MYIYIYHMYIYISIYIYSMYVCHIWMYFSHNSTQHCTTDYLVGLTRPAPTVPPICATSFSVLKIPTSSAVPDPFDSFGKIGVYSGATNYSVSVQELIAQGIILRPCPLTRNAPANTHLILNLLEASRIFGHYTSRKVEISLYRAATSHIELQ